ncbi:MAG: type II secretion system protein [Candidatus Gastranaerophilaceae bacterium]|nr:type II secretion system protein [Candidatus Gastranaerophilaceae bacterium]
MSRNTAFTLAEVLITLGIIGVVAAMTLPTLIGNYQKKQVISQLKKAFSEYAQAMQMAQVENGTLDTWALMPSSDFNNNQLEQSKYFGEKYLFPNIKTLNICIPTSSECWADDVKNLNNESMTNPHFTNQLTNKAISFITPAGYSVYYWLHKNGNGMWYTVDVNGPKNRPNQLGKDIFAFGASWGMQGAKVKPMGISDSTETVEYTREDILSGNNVAAASLNYKCKKETSTDPLGGYCAALIVLDGWEIKDDYPW